MGWGGGSISLEKSEIKVSLILRTQIKYVILFHICINTSIQHTETQESNLSLTVVKAKHAHLKAYCSKTTSQNIIIMQNQF
jgi:hypothetical protein